MAKSIEGKWRTRATTHVVSADIELDERPYRVEGDVTLLSDRMEEATVVVTSVLDAAFNRDSACCFSKQDQARMEEALFDAACAVEGRIQAALSDDARDTEQRLPFVTGLGGAL